jgi:hypothetical protein
LIWPLAGLYQFKLLFRVGNKKKKKVTFFLTLIFECEDNYCMASNCTVILERGTVEGEREGGGGGEYSSSSYLATSSSSP